MYFIEVQDKYTDIIGGANNWLEDVDQCSRNKHSSQINSLQSSSQNSDVSQFVDKQNEVHVPLELLNDAFDGDDGKIVCLEKDQKVAQNLVVSSQPHSSGLEEKDESVQKMEEECMTSDKWMDVSQCEVSDDFEKIHPQFNKAANNMKVSSHQDETEIKRDQPANVENVCDDDTVLVMVQHIGNQDEMKPQNDSVRNQMLWKYAVQWKSIRSNRKYRMNSAID